MPDEVVLYEVSERVATVTLNRPEARNALSRAVQRGLGQALERADGDDDVDVVVLTGADPAFCAGVDLKEAARDGAVAPDYDEAAMSAYMKRPELEVWTHVGVGTGCATLWTCDLTHGYVSINGDYRS